MPDVTPFIQEQVVAHLPDYPVKGQRKSLDQDWLHTLYQEGIAAFCSEVPRTPAGLLQGIAEFNLGRYWHSHETLEALWLPERYPLRLFYHGLIKAAVGLLHLQRRNRSGAVAKLGDATFTLAPFSPRFMDVDIASLTEDLQQRLGFLRSGADTNWPAIESLPRVRLHPLE